MSTYFPRLPPPPPTPLDRTSVWLVLISKYVEDLILKVCNENVVDIHLLSSRLTTAIRSCNKDIVCS